jgi:hypothetical protein
VPFKVTKLQAQNKWREWIRGLWLAPGALKKYAQSDGGIKGIYTPYWTFDAQTYTNYSGQRGDNYQEQYTTTNDKGERITQTRTETRWTNVSGSVSFFHDDVLVSGSGTTFGTGAAIATKDPEAAKALAQMGGMGSRLLGAFSTKLSSWNTKELVPYQEEYITGFQAEAYEIGLKKAFGFGKEIIDRRVESLVNQDIGGDHQRITSLNTQYSHLTFKHILLPMWVSAYLFSGKTYRFVVNGQTGEVQGESPKSGWKIFFLVVAGLLLLILLLSIFGGKR